MKRISQLLVLIRRSSVPLSADSAPKLEMWALYRRKIEKMDEPVTAARTHMAPVRPLGGSVNIKSMDLLVPFWPSDLCLCGSSRPSPKDSNRNEAIKLCLGDDTMIRSRTRLSIRPPRPFQPPLPPPPCTRTRPNYLFIDFDVGSEAIKDCPTWGFMSWPRRFISQFCDLRL